MTAELRLGRWQDVLGDVECDALIVDAPYSERTHGAHNSATRSAQTYTGRYGHRRNTRTINYDCLSADDVDEMVASWAPRTRGWMVSITDHTLAPVWADAMSRAHRYVFPPVPLVEIGSRVRLTGDGPSSWTCQIVVSRPKTRAFARWGTLRGAYIYTGRGDRVVMGGKRLDAMRDIVRDYTRSGDLVCDPCAGGGTTLLAARLEGRRAIGAEMMSEHYAIATERLREMPGEAGGQMPMFGDSDGVV